MSFVAKLDSRFYPDYRDNWDDWRLRDLILEYVNSESIVLDLGAGAGIIEAMNLRDNAARVSGIDPDPRVVENPFLDEGVVGFAEQLPYDDKSFDVVYCDNLMEHLPDPTAVLSEVRRVLRPHGHFVFKTPNRRHYVPLASRLTPTTFHKWFNKKRGRSVEDTFETHYRANTPSAIAQAAQRAGLVVDKISVVEGRPEYLRINGFVYMLGIAYERIVNSSEAFKRFRVVILGVCSIADSPEQT